MDVVRDKPQMSTEYYPHISAKQKETQRGSVTCPGTCTTDGNRTQTLPPDSKVLPLLILLPY